MLHFESSKCKELFICFDVLYCFIYLLFWGTPYYHNILGGRFDYCCWCVCILVPPLDWIPCFAFLAEVVVNRSEGEVEEEEKEEGEEAEEKLLLWICLCLLFR